MYGVVNEGGGTAAAIKLQGIEFCGKSGTAQVIGENAKTRFGKGEKKFNNTAWFVGYAPRRDPEIVVAVLVEEGGHGASASGPIVRDIIKAYYDKKAKKGQGQTTVELKRYDLDGDSGEHVAERSKPAAKPEQAVAAVEPVSARKPRPE
jgi:penicillin-binding protein 2